MMSESSAWVAPHINAPVNATVLIPGSKSLTARALYLAAVASDTSHLYGVLSSRDTDLFTQALVSLGASISGNAPDLSLTPLPWLSSEGSEKTSALPLHIDCGLAGTVMRFLPPLAALAGQPVTFDGDEGARLRPLAPLLDALSRLGATIDFHGEPGFLPFTIQGPLHAPKDGILSVDASASSQFVTALLLVAPLLGDTVIIRPTGAIVSRPHIDMTVDALRHHGVVIDDSDPHQWVVSPGRPLAQDTRIEPDLSNAGPFLAAAQLSGGSIRIPSWPTQTTQAGDAWREILPQLGATVIRHPDGTVEVTGCGAYRFPGVDIDLSAVGELVPTLAAILVFATSPSRLRGVGHLRGHETDRLAALVTEIQRLGAGAKETDDGLIITPAPMTGTHLQTYHDHRMATFAAIVGLLVPGVTVENIETTSKTLPQFPRMWAEMLGAADAS